MVDSCSLLVLHIRSLFAHVMCFSCVMLLQQELKDLSATKGQLAAELSEANGKIHVGPCVAMTHLPYFSFYMYLFFVSMLSVSLEHVASNPFI